MHTRIKNYLCKFVHTCIYMCLCMYIHIFTCDLYMRTLTDTPATKLPFFKFVLVDEKVAVAIGRSGSAALWARIEG